MKRIIIHWTGGPQPGKWDVSWLPNIPDGNAEVCGDFLRESVRSALQSSDPDSILRRIDEIERRLQALEKRIKK
jgi:hypothetical protein